MKACQCSPETLSKFLPKSDECADASPDVPRDEPPIGEWVGSGVCAGWQRGARADCPSVRVGSPDDSSANSESDPGRGVPASRRRGRAAQRRPVRPQPKGQASTLANSRTVPRTRLNQTSGRCRRRPPRGFRRRGAGLRARRGEATGEDAKTSWAGLPCEAEACRPASRASTNRAGVAYVSAGWDERRPTTRPLIARRCKPQR